MPKLTLLTKKRSYVAKRSLSEDSWGKSSFDSQPPLKKHRELHVHRNRGKLSLFEKIDDYECEDINISQESISINDETFEENDENDISLIESQASTACNEGDRSPVFASSQMNTLPIIDDQEVKDVNPRRFLSELSPTFNRTKTCADESPIISSCGSQSSTPSSRLVCVTDFSKFNRKSESEKKPRRRASKNGEAGRLQQLITRWQSELSIWRHALRTQESNQEHLSLIAIQSYSLFSQIDVKCKVSPQCSHLLPNGVNEIHLILSKSLHSCDLSTFPEGSKLLVYPPWDIQTTEKMTALWNIWNLAVEH